MGGIKRIGLCNVCAVPGFVVATQFNRKTDVAQQLISINCATQLQRPLSAPARKQLTQANIIIDLMSMPDASVTRGPRIFGHKIKIRRAIPH